MHIKLIQLIKLERYIHDSTGVNLRQVKKTRQKTQ